MAVTSYRALPIGTLRVLSAGSYTLLADDAVLICDCTAGGVTVNLHKISPFRLHRLNVVKTDTTANIVTVNAFAGDLIENGAASFTLTYPESAVEIVDDGTSTWWVIADAKAFVPPGPPPPPETTILSFASWATEATATVTGQVALVATSTILANILVDTDDVYAQDWHDLKIRNIVPGVGFDIICRPSVGSFKGNVTAMFSWF